MPDMQEPRLDANRVIHKLTLTITDRIEASTALNSGQVVHVEADPTAPDRRICIWYIIDQNWAYNTETVAFRIFGTGHPIDGPHQYLGTAITATALVFHVFLEV
ncbi:hypothetical protein Mbo2_065 [Rhodococcus phage Mbo2]|uniref:DUF7352 domain-containing protein n=1 Tax=Rhodococcus phage Mbo2 TaxID=2936911 RepID=A0A9E7IFN7_9CAUD|nr:hypothetical protein Mbo2_065 [Rhodococcus phage Mbo2]